MGIDPQVAIGDILGALLSIVLRTNDMRSKLKSRCLVPSKITIEFDVPQLTPAQEQLLRQAHLTAFGDSQPFGSTEEVHQYFRRESLQLALGGSAPDFSDEVLAQMAEVVILTRTHCQF